jgi:hypothetical protein
MFGANQFGSAYFGQGPAGQVVIVLFGSVLIATLVSLNPTLTADSNNVAWIVADGNIVRMVEFLG